MILYFITFYHFFLWLDPTHIKMFKNPGGGLHSTNAYLLLLFHCLRKVYLNHSILEMTIYGPWSLKKVNSDMRHKIVIKLKLNDKLKD